MIIRNASTLFTAIALSLLSAGHATAQSPASRYITFDLDECEVVERYEESAGIVLRCVGPQGFEFYAAEGDLRFVFGYGPNGRQQRSFSQTLRPFNYTHNVMELRHHQGEAMQPYATILRYFTDAGTGDENDKGQVLVVTKLSGGEACHMAYVDALANPDANELAREAADNAESFDCETDEPYIIGESGESPM